MRRPLVLAAACSVVAIGVAFGSGAANRLGVGPTITLWRAGRKVERLPRIMTMPSMGLEARVPADTRCWEAFGTRCEDARFRRIAWSVCGVERPEPPYARTRRTDTCHPDDIEEGVAADVWTQEGVGRVSLGGFDGYIVSWWPGAHAKRGDGCSFRGYRRDGAGRWAVLHIEVSSACDDEALAVMLSTRAAGEVHALPLASEAP